MGGFSLWHILIFAVIVLLLFGGNRFSAMMGDVAKGIKSFKSGLAEDDKPSEPNRQIPQQPPQQQQPPIEITPARPGEASAQDSGDDPARR